MAPPYSDTINMQPLNNASSASQSARRRVSDDEDGGEDGAVGRRRPKTWSTRGTQLVDGVRQIGRPIVRQSIAFFLFGLLNNTLYVVILTAALELIPKGTPTGLVSFFNIFPALIAKGVWPYVLRGRVRYRRRIWSCVAMSTVGLAVIALLPSLWTRLAGIALASFSSGLGELTYLQLSTRFSRAGAGRSVGWFSSGTGAAGLVGASAWWIVRPMGVRNGLLSLAFLPLLMGIAYGLILPSVQDVDGAELDTKGQYEPLHSEAYNANGVEEEEDDEEDGDGGAAANNAPMSEAGMAKLDDDDDDADAVAARVRLSLADKMQLIKPMLFVFIVPLVLVYFFEYTINQGIAPTLLYPLPTRATHPLLSLVIKELRDYYPFYQLTYQTFVFLSRSSISIFRLPAIPKRFLWLPALLQGVLMVVLTTESMYSWFRASIASPLAIVLVCVEGMAGGSAYVSVFYQIGTDDAAATGPSVPLDEGAATVDDDNDDRTAATKEARRAQEHEFRIGCVGVGDSAGILLASLIAMPLELSLCDAQVRRGKTLCKEV